MAAARALGFNNIPSVKATPQEVDLLGRMMLAESASIRNKFGKPQTKALQAVADVVRNRVLSEKFPNTVGGVLTQNKQFSPLNNQKPSKVGANFPKSDIEAAKRVAASVLAGETAPVVGNSLNYGNLNTINSKKGYSSRATKSAFNSMKVEAEFKDARNPNTRQHSFGTIGKSDVSLNGPVRTSAPPTQTASGPQAVDPTRASPIPQSREQIAGITGGIIGRNLTRSPMPSARPSTFPGRPERVGSFPVARTTSSFPGRPGVVGTGFPAEDRRPSTFPGRPGEMAGAFPAARQPSTFPGRPSFPGAFPAEDRQPSTFPGRPALAAPGFASMIASRPTINPGFQSKIAGRTEVPGALPAASPRSSFPARPGFPGAFPAEDRMPSAFPARPEFKGMQPTMGPMASTFPARPGFPGAFPAAQPAANPMQFAESPLGQGLGRLGRGIGFGMTGLGKALKAYDDNKGKLAFGRVLGINPIGTAVKAGLSNAIGAGQNKLAGLGQPGPSQVASASPANPAVAAQVAQQRNALVGALREAVGNGGPKTPQEQMRIKRIVQAIQALPDLSFAAMEA